jgi:hypothetical protein
MKKEEPSVNSSRGNPCEHFGLNRSGEVGLQTTGSLSRPGRTVTARTEKPAWSRFLGSSMVVVVDASNADAVYQTLLGALA